MCRCEWSVMIFYLMRVLVVSIVRRCCLQQFLTLLLAKLVVYHEPRGVYCWWCCGWCQFFRRSLEHVKLIRDFFWWLVELLHYFISRLVWNFISAIKKVEAMHERFPIFISARRMTNGDVIFFSSLYLLPLRSSPHHIVFDVRRVVDTMSWFYVDFSRMCAQAFFVSTRSIH